MTLNYKVPLSEAKGANAAEECFPQDANDDTTATSRQEIQELRREVQKLKKQVANLSLRSSSSKRYYGSSSASSSSSPASSSPSFSSWGRFMHSRTDDLYVASIMRIFYAFLVMIDRLTTLPDLDTFMNPKTGLIPIEFGRSEIDSYKFTIFQLAPDSMDLIWIVYWTSFVSSVMLLLGIAPRFNALIVYLSHVSFQHHNEVMWDGQDVLFRVLNFLLLFMPLHHWTIWEWWERRRRRKTRTKTTNDTSVSNGRKVPADNVMTVDTWPMWPFRLFQIQMCLIYWGCYTKLTGAQWRSGRALYYIVHLDDFYGKLFNPDVLFNRMISLRFMTWLTLFVECSAPILVWFEPLRIPTIVMVWIFHLGMDLSLNMHCFEWLTMLGWLSFLALPVEEEEDDEDDDDYEEEEEDDDDDNGDASEQGSSWIPSKKSTFLEAESKDKDI